MLLTHEKLLARAREGKPEEALRIALAFLSQSATDYQSWYSASVLCIEIGATKTGISGLTGVGEEFAENGNLPMALACVREIDEAGGDSSDLRAAVALLYGKGSRRVADRALPPPPLPLRVDDSLLENFRPERGFLVQETERLVNAARESGKLGRSMSERHPNVPFFPMFGSLGMEGFLRLLDAFSVRRFGSGETLMQQGKPSDEMMMLARGEVVVNVEMKDGESREVAVLGPGSLIGEMGMVARTPRSATVLARTDGIVLVAPIDGIEAIAEDLAEVADVIVAFCEIRLLENLLSVSTVLHPIAAAERAQAVRMFDHQYLEAGESAITEGDEPRGIYLVVSGELSVVKTGTANATASTDKADRSDKVRRPKSDTSEITYITTLKAGDVFGEISTVMNRPATATVQAVSGAALLFLPRDRFLELTRRYPAVFQKIYEISVKRQGEIDDLAKGKASSADDMISD